MNNLTKEQLEDIAYNYLKPMFEKVRPMYRLDELPENGYFPDDDENDVPDFPDELDIDKICFYHQNEQLHIKYDDVLIGYVENTYDQESDGTNVVLPVKKEFIRVN